MFSVKRFTLIAAIASVSAFSWGAKICIDPGHGGSDPGATGIGGYEKNNVLDSCLRFRNWLNADTNDGAGGGSWTNVMTRSSDVSVSLASRCAISNNNGANRFMSTHNNAFNDNANGTETFSYSGTGTAADLRNKVQQRTIEAWGLLNRGNKTAGFYVLVNTAAPAELAELGFVDANPDAGYVSNATHREKCARYHLYAIQNHYGIGAYTPGSSNPTLPTYTLDNNQAGFSVVGTWATATSAADKHGSDYRYKSTAAVSEPASWAINVGVAGTYNIQAWWAAGTNRSASAPYIMPNNATVNVNQQANGGRWNTLGRIGLGTGTNTTKLSCWAASGFVVVADAVRYAP